MKHFTTKFSRERKFFFVFTKQKKQQFEISSSVWAQSQKWNNFSQNWVALLGLVDAKGAKKMYTGNWSSNLSQQWANYTFFGRAWWLQPSASTKFEKNCFLLTLRSCTRWKFKLVLFLLCKNKKKFFYVSKILLWSASEVDFPR